MIPFPTELLVDRLIVSSLAGYRSVKVGREQGPGEVRAAGDL